MEREQTSETGALRTTIGFGGSRAAHVDAIDEAVQTLNVSLGSSQQRLPRNELFSGVVRIPEFPVPAPDQQSERDTLVWNAHKLLLQNANQIGINAHQLLAKPIAELTLAFHETNTARIEEIGPRCVGLTAACVGFYNSIDDFQNQIRSLMLDSERYVRVNEYEELSAPAIVKHFSNRLHQIRGNLDKMLTYCTDIRTVTERSEFSPTRLVELKERMADLVHGIRASWDDFLSPTVYPPNPALGTIPYIPQVPFPNQDRNTSGMI